MIYLDTVFGVENWWFSKWAAQHALNQIDFDRCTSFWIFVMKLSDSAEFKTVIEAATRFARVRNSSVNKLY